MNTERDIGRLEAVAESLEKQNSDLRKELSQLREEVAEIKQLIAQIKGGSRVLMFLWGLSSGGVGAAIFKYGAILLAK